MWLMRNKENINVIKNKKQNQKFAQGQKFEPRTSGEGRTDAFMVATISTLQSPPPLPSITQWEFAKYGFWARPSCCLF